MKPDQPIVIRKSTQVAAPLVLWISLVVLCTSAGIAYSNLNRDVEAAQRDLKSDEDRLNVLEKNQADIAVMRNDVEWLRRNAEHRP